MYAHDISITTSPKEVTIQCFNDFLDNVTVTCHNDGSLETIQLIGNFVESLFRGLTLQYGNPVRQGDSYVLAGKLDSVALYYPGYAYQITYSEDVITVWRDGVCCRKQDERFTFQVPSDVAHLTPLFLALVHAHYPVITQEEIRAKDDHFFESIKSVLAIVDAV